MNHASSEDSQSGQSRLVAFLDFDICHLLVENIKIKKATKLSEKAKTTSVDSPPCLHEETLGP